MKHEFFDEDIEGWGLHDNIYEGKFIFVESVEDEDGNYASSLNFKMEDLQYMAEKLGGSLVAVSPNTVTTQLSREDIIMLAKTAGITVEELG